MATPKKKHLIELMIEAGVKWPEGAEYAAQDNRDLYVWFYSEKPKFAGVNKGKWTSDVNYENGRKCRIVDGEKLNEICRNWHQTIVTREQYAEALAAAGNVSDQVVDTVDAVEWHNPPSIEQLTADYHTKAAEADRLQSVADEALKDADDALLALEKAGELIGLVISIDTKPKLVAQPVEQEQPIITDWRDLRVGDVVECVLVHGENGLEDDAYNNRFHGARCNVVGLTENGKNHIETDLKPSGYYIQEFKFISRP